MNLEMAVESGLVAEEAKSRLRDLTADEEALLSPRLAAQSHFWRFEMRRGFIMAAQITGAPDDPPTAEAVEALFADPHAALLGALDLRDALDHVVIEAVLAAPRPSIRQLDVFDLGAKAPLLEAQLPGLDTLVLHVAEPGARHAAWCGTVDELAHASLRNLVADPRSCPAIATSHARLPMLESLSWELDANAFDGRSLLFQPPPRLKELALSWSDWNERELVARLAATPTAHQLEVLSVGGGGDLFDELAARASSFPKLVRLQGVLHDDDLSPGDRDALVARCEAAYGAALDVTWELPATVPSDASPGQVGPFDEASRGPDGKIDAIGSFSRGRDK